MQKHNYLLINDELFFPYLSNIGSSGQAGQRRDHLQRHARRPQPRMSKRKKFLIRRQLNSWAQLDACHAFLADIDADDLSSGHAESIQHLCAYKTSLANMPAKGKKGERGPRRVQSYPLQPQRR